MVVGMGTRIQAFLERYFSHPGKHQENPMQLKHQENPMQ